MARSLFQKPRIARSPSGFAGHYDPFEDDRPPAWARLRNIDFEQRQQPKWQSPRYVRILLKAAGILGAAAVGIFVGFVLYLIIEAIIAR